MEFFSILRILFQFFSTPTYGPDLVQNNLLGMLPTYLIAAGVYLLVYVLRAIALFTMARKRGMDRLVWCAFVPFASTYLIGKLAGPLKIGNFTIRNVGIVAMVSEIVYALVLGGYYGILSHIFINGWYRPGNAYGYYNAAGEEVISYYTWTFDNIANVSAVASVLNVLSVLSFIIEILYLIALCLLLIPFLRTYAPMQYPWLVFLCVVFPVLFAPLAFAFRNRVPVDYEQYRRARYEAFVREQQVRREVYEQYERNMQNGAPTEHRKPTARPDDPFGEFSEPSEGEKDDPFGELGKKNDDEDRPS